MKKIFETEVTQVFWMIVKWFSNPKFFTIAEINDAETRADKWLHKNNPLLGDISPITMIKIGRFNQLVSFIEYQINQNISPRKNDF